MLGTFLVVVQAGLFKTGLRQPRVSVKSDFISKSFINKFIITLFVYNFMTECCKKTFEYGNKENRIKI